MNSLSSSSSKLALKMDVWRQVGGASKYFDLFLFKLKLKPKVISQVKSKFVELRLVFTLFSICQSSITLVLNVFSCISCNFSSGLLFPQ